MDFISWLVIGVLFMLAEFGTGSYYLLAIGLGCAYPAYASYADATIGTQLAAFALGVAVHALVVNTLRKLSTDTPASTIADDVGQRVEVIEWLGEGAARVKYRGVEWDADKADIAMPDSDHGIIQSVQYGRLIISTDQTLPENA